MSNFEFLKKDNSYKIFTDACIEAEELMNVSYSATVTFVRKALELAVKWVYANDAELRMPQQANLATLIKGKKFRDIIPYNMSGLLSCTPPYTYSFDGEATYGAANIGYMGSSGTVYVKDNNGCRVELPVVMTPNVEPH